MLLLNASRFCCLWGPACSPAAPILKWAPCWQIGADSGPAHGTASLIWGLWFTKKSEDGEFLTNRVIATVGGTGPP